MKKVINIVITRQAAAHMLMTSCIILLGFGLSILNLGMGLATAGLACGIYGYLLGAE